MNVESGKEEKEGKRKERGNHITEKIEERIDKPFCVWVVVSQV